MSEGLAPPYPLELVADDAEEGWAQQRPVDGRLEDPADEDIDVVHGAVERLQPRHVHGGELLGQHLPGLHPAAHSTGSQVVLHNTLPHLGCPHRVRQLLYGARPWSRPRWMLRLT